MCAHAQSADPSRLCDPLGRQPLQAPLSLAFSGKNTAVVVPSSGIFPGQGLNMHLYVSCAGRQVSSLLTPPGTYSVRTGLRAVADGKLGSVRVEYGVNLER